MGKRVRWWAGLLAAAVAGVGALSPSDVAQAAAAAPVADLAVSATAASHPVGAYVHFKVDIYDYGPKSVRTGDVHWDYYAPPGTELVGESALSATAPPSSFASGYCTWVTPKTHVRCVNQAYVGDYGFVGPGVTEPHSYRLLWVKIDRAITGNGTYTVACFAGGCTDPKSSNNSVRLVATAPKPKPTPRPSLRPSASPSPSSQVATPIPSDAPTTTAAVAASTIDTTAGATPSVKPVAVHAGLTDDSWGVAIAVATVLIVGAGGLVLWRLRRRPVPEALRPDPGTSRHTAT